VRRHAGSSGILRIDDARSSLLATSLSVIVGEVLRAASPGRAPDGLALLGVMDHNI